MSDDAVLLAMQAPSGVPRSQIFETVTDPLLPSSQTSEMLSHFFDGVYDKSPESHLSRLLKVLLGDSGAGQLRKRYTYAHLSQFVLTANYNDLDRLYASVFGLGRFLRERLDIDPYLDAATDAEWEAIDTADASYRNRVAAFARAIPWAGTPNGMVMAASAVLGDECRVYENYDFIDTEGEYGAVDSSLNTWGDLEAHTWGYYDGRTWGSMEGGASFQGKANSRTEFIVRPLRTITDEEQYHLTKVLSRLKPAKALMTIDSRPATLYTPIPVHRAVASSTYWHIQSKVQVNPKYATAYSRVDETKPVEQPRYAFAAYQGEAWTYNSDVASVSSYVMDASGNVVQDHNYERITTPSGSVLDYTPQQALQSAEDILRGRAVSDGIMSAPVAVREVPA